MRKLVLFFAMGLMLTTAFAQNTEKPRVGIDPKMEWFEQAKLGIFIHWGVYAVDGTAESWAFFNNHVPYDQYMSQLKGFTAAKYDPKAWAKLFKEAGAGYVVMTSKHHDGVALWGTKQSKLNVVDATPAKRELLSPYASALREEGLKVGIYFSHLDWSHPDYASVFKEKPIPAKYNSYDFPASGEEDYAKWERFKKFERAQLKELQELVQPDLWWFDGDWTRTAEQWGMKELRQTLLSWNPQAILNARMCGYGDYGTPEQGVPLVAPKGPWELCMTINNSWGYRPIDKYFKSPNYIIRIFSECISKGGNLLLDVGPKADGTIPEEQVAILKELGRWTSKNHEAIYPAERGIPLEHFYGPTTLSKDRKTLYCFLMDDPKNEVVVKGIKNKITNVRVIGSDLKPTYKMSGGAPWAGIPGELLIKIPQAACDKYTTVLAVEFDSPIDLYRGEGGAIEAN